MEVNVYQPDSERSNKPAPITDEKLRSECGFLAALCFARKLLSSGLINDDQFRLFMERSASTFSGFNASIYKLTA